MKKKLLSFILAMCLLIPCSLALTACGSNPPDHTHNWSSDWSYNSVDHWKTCDGCDEKKDKANHDGDVCSVCGYEAYHTHDWPETYTYNDSEHWKICSVCFQETTRVTHDYENKVCKDCGYENADADLDIVTSVRDLEVITFDTGDLGLFTLVRLPDGKNMLIDSGDERFATYMMVEDTLLYAEGLWAIDYFVLTNTNAARTGQAAYIMQNFEVLNLYTPRVINSAPSCYTTAVAMASDDCNVVEVAESNCDISYSFRVSGSNTVYNYTIDFMLPVATADCESDFDASIVISIEYQGKTILITGDNTVANIDGYRTKYGGSKDVDVLITSFVFTEPYAITNSLSRGGDYLESISLEAGDYAIVSPISSDSHVDVLKSALAGIVGWDKVYVLTDANNLYTAYVKINSSGEITVTAE